MNNLQDLKFALDFTTYNPEQKADWKMVSENKNEVIAGFLNIGNKDGWKQSEGNRHEVGFRFTRFMFGKFCSENAYGSLRDYKDILEPAFAAFSPIAQKEGATPRAQVDTSVTGWYRHSVSRIAGTVGTKNTENGPFFEVLINSQRTGDNPYCFPFKVCVLPNKQAAESRWEHLQKLDKVDSTLAYPAFYQSKYESPDEYLLRYKKEHGKDPGPNGLRLLEGIKYLELQKMKAQTIGNCWMKQNVRQVLTALFIETLTNRPELSSSQAWTLSNKLYKRWTDFTRNEIQGMIKERKGLCLDLIKIVEQKFPSPAGVGV